MNINRNPLEFTRNHFGNLFHTGVNAHKSGVQQSKSDVISVKNAVNTAPEQAQVLSCQKFFNLEPLFRRLLLEQAP